MFVVMTEHFLSKIIENFYNTISQQTWEHLISVHHKPAGFSNYIIIFTHPMEKASLKEQWNLKDITEGLMIISMQKEKMQTKACLKMVKSIYVSP